MQAVLCLIFGASVAMAQWVVHDRTVNGSSRLAPTASLGLISVRPPEGWAVKTTEDPPCLEAMETTDDERPRVLKITAERVGREMTVENYLMQKEPELPLQSKTRSISIGSTQGILMSVTAQRDTLMLPRAGPVDDKLIAGCVTADGIAISIDLMCPDELPGEKPANVQLIRDVARRIQVQIGPGK